MKLQIVKNIEDCVDGYTPIIVADNGINIDVPANSVSDILVINTIENIDYNSIDQFLVSIKNLLRLNGKFCINGIDVNYISRDLINRAIDVQAYNSIIFTKKSIYDSKELSDKISKLGLKITKISFRGSIYEIHGIRSE